MSETISFNGTNYPGIPNTKGETGWQTTLTNYLRAIASGTLQPIGGSFTLLNEVDFGTSYGAKFQYIKDQGANPASTGLFVRASYGSKIGWRNNANTGDNYLLPDSSDRLTYNGVILASATGFTPNRAIISTSTSGLTAATATTDTEIGYVNGVTGAIQTQINNHLANTTTPHGVSGAVVGTVNVQTIYTKTFGDAAVYTQIATPGNPSSGFNKLYPKSDGFFYALDSAGGEKRIGSGAGSINYFQNNSDIESGTTGYSVLADGDTATVTIASPSVFTSAHNHGMVVGQPLYLTTTGALPTNFAINTLYYVSVVGAANTFQLSATLGGASINGTTSQSGVHTFRPSIPINGVNANIAATATIAASSSTALRGSKNLLFTPGNVGDYVVYTITPDSADTATMLQFSFDYKITTPASYTDGDLQVYLYDVGNSVMLQPAPYKVLANSLVGHFSCVFQTPGANMSTIRVIIIQNTVTTTYGSVRLDNFACGPQSRAYGAPITDWVSYTPTIGSGFGTPTNVAFRSRRVGDTLEVMGFFTAGTVAANPSTITIGYNGGNANVNIDTAKVNSTNQFCGVGASNSTPSTTYFGYIACIIPSSPTTSIGLGIQTSTVGAGVAQNGNAVCGTGNVVSVHFAVPILGWGSTVLMSQDVDNRICVATVSGDPASATVGNPIIVPTVGYDSHGGYNASTGRYTCPLPGFYKIFGSLQSASSATTLTIYKNAVSTALAGNLDSNGEATYCGMVQCVAGDVIDLRPGGTVDATSMTMFIERTTGPAAIAATESVTARYTNAAGTTLTKSSQQSVPFATKDYDSHGAFVTDTFTAPVAGKYSVKATITIASGATWANGDAVDLFIQKNAADHTVYQYLLQASTTGAFSVTVVGSVNCIAGDTIRIQANPIKAAAGNVTMFATGTFNTFSIERVGN